MVSHLKSATEVKGKCYYLCLLFKNSYIKKNNEEKQRNQKSNRKIKIFLKLDLVYQTEINTIF